MPYTHTTFADAKQSLAEELGDAGKVFFTDAELGSYLIESLRWWGLESMYFRETGKITTVASQPFYRIETDLKDSLGVTLLQGLSVTDRELINDINLALMEPVISAWAGGWIGTEMFDLGTITSTLQEIRDEFLKLTGCLATQLQFFPVSQRTSLADTFIRILRADINEQGSTGPIPLQPADQVQVQTTSRSSVIPGPKRPRAFSISYTPQLTVDLWPPPATNSTLNLQAIETGGTLNPTSLATVLKIPDDAAFILKYGVLQELFGRDGLARSPQMAQYCSQRYLDGLECMSRYQSVLWANIAESRRPITSVDKLDQLRPTWRQGTGGLRSVAQLNWNTLALNQVPNGISTITFEAIRKAPIPILDADFIQVGRESMTAIYDYAHHIALIKCQGSEFEASLARYVSAKDAAQDYRQQIASQSYLYRDTQLPAIDQRRSRPYRRQVAVEAAKQDRQFIEE